METAVIESPETEATSDRPAITRAAREGLKGLFKAQNILLDFAVEQNEIAFKAVRERMKSSAATPASALIDSVEEIVKGMVSVQKSIVEMGEERLEREPAAKEETESAPEKRTLPKLPLGELLRKNFETAVEAQREVLGYVEKQSKLGVKAADEFARFSVGKTLKNLTTMARESVGNALETQGRLIDLTAKQGKASIETLTRDAKGEATKDFAKYAEEGIDNLSRAQKRLIEVAAEMNGRPEAAGEFPAASKLAERIERGIERAIKSQNEMLDAGLRAVNRGKAVEA